MSLRTKTGTPVSLERSPHALLLALAVCASLLITFPTAAFAHPPKEVSLAYDAVTGVLSVTVTHSTFFPSKHYVKTVAISQNGKAIQSAPYTSQPTSDTFTYTFPVKAVPGDELSAVASCNIFGSAEGKLAIPK